VFWQAWEWGPRNLAANRFLTTSFNDMLREMTGKGLGFTAVAEPEGRVLGIFTDGDLRRLLGSGVDLRTLMIREVMTRFEKLVTAHVGVPMEGSIEDAGHRDQHDEGATETDPVRLAPRPNRGEIAPKFLGFQARGLVLCGDTVGHSETYAGEAADLPRPERAELPRARAYQRSMSWRRGVAGDLHDEWRISIPHFVRSTAPSAAMLAAIREGHAASIRYLDPRSGEETRRTIEAVGLVCRGDA